MTFVPVLVISSRVDKGQVAQLVEQRTENPRVGGSIPPLATISQGELTILKNHVQEYKSRLIKILSSSGLENSVPQFIKIVEQAWKRDKTVFFCGNGGSAGNAIHLVNDFIYGAGKTNGKGLRAVALSANPAIITCLANDVGYEFIFSEQLRVAANQGDVLVVFSGSGNSENIVNALNVANELGLDTVAVVGYDGGRAKSLAKLSIHTPISDMQISEDLQLIIGHMLMQWFSQIKI